MSDKYNLNFGIAPKNRIKYLKSNMVFFWRHQVHQYKLNALKYDVFSVNKIIKRWI